jgi:hypothetical protein
MRLVMNLNNLTNDEINSVNRVVFPLGAVRTVEQLELLGAKKTPLYISPSYIKCSSPHRKHWKPYISKHFVYPPFIPSEYELNVLYLDISDSDNETPITIWVYRTAPTKVPFLNGTVGFFFTNYWFAHATLVKATINPG